MKKCPQCEEVYENSNDYCLQDGSHLLMADDADETVTLPNQKHLAKFTENTVEILSPPQALQKKTMEEHAAEIITDIVSRRKSNHDVYYYPDIDLRKLQKFENLVKRQLDYKLNCEEVLFYVNDPSKEERGTGFAITKNEIIICRYLSEDNYINKLIDFRWLINYSRHNTLSFESGSLYQFDFLGRYAISEIKSVVSEYRLLMQEIYPKYGTVEDPPIRYVRRDNATTHKKIIFLLILFIIIISVLLTILFLRKT